MNTIVHGGDLPGLRKLRQMLEDAGRGVMVGVPAGAAEEDGTSLAMIGAVHEFGLPEQNIPERSWLRGGIRAAREKLSRVNIASLKDVLAGKATVTGALDKLGVVAAGEVKRGFVTQTFAPLKPATIAERKRKFGKSSTRPLVATGQLRQSVAHQLEPAGAKARVI